jgi:hypothetical protein
MADHSTGGRYRPKAPRAHSEKPEGSKTALYGAKELVREELTERLIYK